MLVDSKFSHYIKKETESVGLIRAGFTNESILAFTSNKIPV
jgi:TRAP-type C4-dicarboxylate transport system substrate-binding protein